MSVEDDEEEGGALMLLGNPVTPDKTPFEKFMQQYDSEAKAVITMQYTPDPDSMASALGMQWLLEVQYGISSEIIARGQVSHPQNLTMRNVLDIPIKDKPKFPYKEYDLVIVVDTVPQNTGFQDDFPEFHAVLDHHQFDLDLAHTDIRPCGACSTIVWTYLDGPEFDWTSDRGVQVATALLFGILNDTQDLLSENRNSTDIAAHSDLITKVDRKKLQEIMQYTLPSYLYDLRVEAVSNKVVKDSMLITSLGAITRKKRDALPLIADEFMRMEGVETVVVFAIVQDHIEASVRSKNSAINVHDFCQRIFGEEYAGGKQGSGGAKTPLGFLYSVSDDDTIKNEICTIAARLLTQRIIAFMSGG